MIVFKLLIFIFLYFHFNILETLEIVTFDQEKSPYQPLTYETQSKSKHCELPMTKPKISRNEIEGDLTEINVGREYSLKKDPKVLNA